MNKEEKSKLLKEADFYHDWGQELFNRWVESGRSPQDLFILFVGAMAIHDKSTVASTLVQLETIFLDKFSRK